MWPGNQVFQIFAGGFQSSETADGDCHRRVWRYIRTRTLEDILEEIVGEYEDEFSDIPKFLDDGDKDGKRFIDPVINLEDLEESIQCSFPNGEYKTLAGLIYKHLDCVPEIGDTVKLPDCKITVEAMDRHRIAQVSFEQTQGDQTKTSNITDTKEKAPKGNNAKIK
jgi:Mg2+/Co2+ transporter CorC